MNRELTYAEQNMGCKNTASPAREDRFATEPAIAARPSMQRFDEEALYTLFEQAISDRLEAVNEHLRLCGRRQRGTRHWSWRDYAWQQPIIVASLALILVMTGFDLMGMLVLCLH